MNTVCLPMLKPLNRNHYCKKACNMLQFWWSGSNKMEKELIFVSSDGNRGNIGNQAAQKRGSTDSGVSFRERRRRSDWLVRASILMSVFAWLVLFAVWIVLYFAGVVGNYGNTPINIITGMPVTHTISYTLLPIAYAMLLFSIAICLLAFLFNRLRMRRKSDRYRKSIFIIGGISIIALIAFLYNFGGYFLW